MFGPRYESGEQHGKAFAFANDEEGSLRCWSGSAEESLVVMEPTGHY